MIVVSNHISKYSYLSSHINWAGSSGSATYFSSSLTTKSWISFIRFSCFSSILSGVGDRSLFRLSFSANILASLSFLSSRKCFPLFSWNGKTEVCTTVYIQSLENFKPGKMGFCCKYRTVGITEKKVSWYIWCVKIYFLVFDCRK